MILYGSQTSPFARRLRLLLPTQAYELSAWIFLVVLNSLIHESIKSLLLKVFKIKKSW